MNNVLAEYLLLDVEFKRDHEDWKFLIHADPFCLQIVIGLEDGTELECRKWLLSDDMTEGELVQTAFMAVLAAQEHEAREFFKWKGRAVFGPHTDIENLWSVSE